mmetsp:Transcript_126782/g.370609  ORF Transcript_126782/g.370609 Transcript_126782/m.370609 type:complete len:269 (-) Transcript_126782:2-808(-)
MRCDADKATASSLSDRETRSMRVSSAIARLLAAFARCSACSATACLACARRSSAPSLALVRHSTLVSSKRSACNLRATHFSEAASRRSEKSARSAAALVSAKLARLWRSSFLSSSHSAVVRSWPRALGGANSDFRASRAAASRAAASCTAASRAAASCVTASRKASSHTAASRTASSHAVASCTASSREATSFPAASRSSARKVSISSRKGATSRHTSDLVQTASRSAAPPCVALPRLGRGGMAAASPLGGMVGRSLSQTGYGTSSNI